MRSKRQMNTDKEVELIFSAPELEARSLLKTLREKYFNIEKIRNIWTIEAIFEMYQLGKYDNLVSTLAKIGQALSVWKATCHHTG